LRNLKFYLASAAILLINTQSATGLSCPAGDGFAPCDDPICCSSGVLTYDACGSCRSCAQAENDECGGPWETRGRCAPDLQCLVKCPCYAIPVDNPAEECIFPFKYKGETYNSCTTFDSENDKPWCAYEVDKDGVVINGKWGDCEGEGCGIGEFQCTDGGDFNYDGKCVKRNSPIESAIIGFLGKPGTYNLRDGIEEGDEIAVCKSPVEQKQCRCVPAEEQTVGGCGFAGGPGNGWCWLENVHNHREPNDYCFEDTVFSKRHGRFYSSSACEPDAKPIDSSYGNYLRRTNPELCEIDPTLCGPSIDDEDSFPIFGGGPPPPPPGSQTVLGGEDSLPPPPEIEIVEASPDPSMTVLGGDDSLPPPPEIEIVKVSSDDEVVFERRRRGAVPPKIEIVEVYPDPSMTILGGDDSLPPPPEIEIVQATLDPSMTVLGGDDSLPPPPKIEIVNEEFVPIG